MNTDTSSEIVEPFDASASAWNGNARGFPLGYFCIRSIATGKLLDVPASETQDGQELILYNEKEKSLVESMREAEADNQVFFIDESGALASKHSGHAVDVEDGVLVLRRRRPLTSPYPTTTTHALPAFHYDPVTGHITVKFESDPAFPPPVPPKENIKTSPSRSPNSSRIVAARENAAKAWKQKHYLLTSIPSRKPRSFVDDAADFFASGASFITNPLSSLSLPFGGSSTEHDHGHASAGVLQKGEEDAKVLNERVSLEHIATGQFDLTEDEVLEEERPEETEVDDDPSLVRKVRVVGYRHQTDLPNSKARDRKRWEILPIRKDRRRF